MTQQAQSDRAIDNDRTAARRIARRPGERTRNDIANNRELGQLVGQTTVTNCKSHQDCSDCCSHPNTSPVRDLNQTSASPASFARVSFGASTGLVIAVPSTSL